jgi:hypothetical protein
MVAKDQVPSINLFRNPENDPLGVEIRSADHSTTINHRL